MVSSNRRDLASGMIFAAIGVSVCVASLSYRMGSASELGPGFFPFCLGVLLAAIGLIVAASSLRSKSARSQPTAAGEFSLKSLAVVVVSFLVFAFVLDQLGLAIATPITVVAAMALSRQARWKEILATTLVLTAGVLAIFVYGLDLQIRVWP